METLSDKRHRVDSLFTSDVVLPPPFHYPPRARVERPNAPVDFEELADELPRTPPVPPVRPLLHHRVQSANYWDSYLGVALNTTGSVGLLTDIAQGSSQQTRVGRRIHMKSLHLRGYIALGTVASAAPLFASFMIVYDRAPTGTLPQPGEILMNSPNPVSFAISHANDDNASRFRIVMRRMYSMNFLRQTDPLIIDEFLDLKGMYTVYGTSALGNLANHKKGALYYLACGQQDPSIPAENMTLYCSSRFRYINAP